MIQQSKNRSISNSIILILICSLFLSSCQNGIIEKIKNDDIIEFQKDDEIMNQAIAEANKTFKNFDDAFKQPQEGYESFAIKVKFDTEDGGGEHIWIGDLTSDGKSYSGTVNNEPQLTKAVKFGDRVTIDPKTISDWMYLDKGVLRGGYTIRVMKNNLSDDEKKAFDQEVGFIIED